MNNLYARGERSVSYRIYLGLRINRYVILTHAIELLSHKSIDLYSFAQIV